MWALLVAYPWLTFIGIIVDAYYYSAVECGAMYSFSSEYTMYVGVI